MRAPDVTLAIRTSLRRPLFAATAVVLIALGTGANAAVFSVVRGVLLKPLPYPEPDRLVAFWPDWFVSNEEIEYWRQRTRSFDAIAAQAPGWRMALTTEAGEPVQVTGARATDNLFTTLGARAALGRTFEPGDALPGQPRVAILADAFWRTRFDGDPAVLGRTVTIDQQPHTIVGVMAAGFEVLGPGTDLWVPWARTRDFFRTSVNQAIARLAPGATVESATAELQALTPAMRADLGRTGDWGRTVRVARLQDEITGDVRPSLFILLGAVGLMLLLAAVNLGTLVLGRSVERIREMAVRTALGASRSRLIRQLVTEQAVLAVAGAGAGLALARVLLPVLVARIPAEVPRTGQIALDWTVFGTVLTASLAIAMVVALVPALLAARPDLQPVLRQTHVTDAPARRRALGMLVAAQIALAVVLGTGAALMLRSLWNLQRVDPGFRPEGLLTFSLQTTSKYFALPSGLPFLEQVSDRMTALPGVERVGAIAHLPLSGYSWTTPAHRDDVPLPPGTSPPPVGWRFILGDYFDTMGIPLLFGRPFTEADRSDAAPVAIVNATLARRFFGEPASAVGRTLVQSSGGQSGDQRVEIVGVVGDVRHLGLDQAPVSEIFRPMAQTFMFPMSMVVRTSGPPAQLAAAVRQAAFEIDPAIPVAGLQPYTTLIAGTLNRPRLLGFLLGVFAGVGLLLGLVGLYGVVAYRVRQREREIGIRLALGADPWRVSRSVMVQGLVYAATGLAVGLPLASWLTQLMDSVIFGVTPHDPATFATLAVIVLAVTAVASLIPARRAAHVDPVQTMRGE
jgi:predicted permease